jgi:hypothetical protein
MISLAISWDTSWMAALQPGRIGGAVSRALRKAGMTALRDMRGEASKRIRARKRLKASSIRKAMVLQGTRGRVSMDSAWAFRMTGKALPLVEYPHRFVAGDGQARSRRTGRYGAALGQSGYLVVEVNRGKKSVVKGGFLARMASGHEGIFRRQGAARLPIEELLGSRPVDPLLKPGEAEAVRERGARSMRGTFERMLPIELGKLGNGAV